MPQDSPATGMPANASGPKTRNTNVLKVVAITTSIIALCGIGFGIYGIVENNNANTKISNLESEIASLRDQLEQKAPTDNQANNTGFDSNTNPGNQDNSGSPDKQDNPDHTAPTKKYLEPQGWGVRFAYPEGVTDVQYDIQDVNWDGDLYITSITKDGKTYNIDLFGGKDSYHHYPFFFGAIARLSATSPLSGWVVYASLLLESNGYKYYRSGGNGYETGDAAEYEEACRIVETLLNNIEAI